MRELEEGGTEMNEEAPTEVSAVSQAALKYALRSSDLIGYFVLEVDAVGDARFIDANGRFAELMDIRPSAMMDQRPAACMKPVSAVALIAKSREAMTLGHGLSYEDTIPRSEGDMRLRIDLEPVQNGDVHHIVGLVIAVKASQRTPSQGDEPWIEEAVIASGDWIWRTDVEHRFVYLSDATIANFDLSRTNVIGRQLEDIVELDDSATDWSSYWDAINSGRPFRNFACRLRLPDGGFRHLELSGRPIKDSEGHFIGYAGSGRDMTTEKSAREEAAQAEERFSEAIESMTDGLALFDARGRLEVANQHLADLLGEDPNLVIQGVRFADLMTRAGSRSNSVNAVRSIQTFLNAKLSAKPGSDHRHDVKLGPGKWVRVTRTRRADGGMVVTFSDISDERRHADELALRELRYRELMERMPDAVLLVCDDRIVFANRAAARLLEAGSPGELVDRALAEFLKAEDTKATLESLGEAAREDSESSEFQVLFRTLGDHDIDVDLTVSANAHHGRRAMQVVARDATQRRQTEAELIAAKQRAEQENKAIAAFYGRISHRLRTPMNNVLGFSEVIRDKLFGPDALDKYADYAADIHNSGERLVNMTDKLIALASISTGEIAANEELVDLPALLLNIVDGNRDLLDKTGSTVELSGSPSVMVSVDQRLLTAAFKELMSNAIEASKAPCSMTLGAHAVGEDMSIYLIDHGPGMDQETLEQVLAPWQEEETMASAGSGLGLPLAHALAALNGGELTIESEIGSGTCAAITLPGGRLQPVTEPVQQDLTASAAQ